MPNLPVFDKYVQILTTAGGFRSYWSNRNNQYRLAMLVPYLSLVSFLGYVENVLATPSELVNTAMVEQPFVKVNLVDATLVDQDVRPVKFASQAIGDRIVAINFIYTTCNTMCPLVSAIFKQLQDKLAKHLGKDVWLVSISLDPITDTPARLKEYAAHYHANPGWLWLTGNASDVEKVLTGLGTTSANFRNHLPQILVGDGKLGTWVQFNALTGPEQIRAELDHMRTARKRGSGVR
jgi:protein SCO1